MTAYKQIKLACDYPHCTAQHNRGHLDIIEARKSAHNEGWKSFRGLIDLCGPTTQTSPWNTGPTRPQNHTTTDHQPTLSAAGKDRVGLACTCGWEYPAAHPPLRILATSQWAAHVEAATATPGGEPHV